MTASVNDDELQSAIETATEALRNDNETKKVSDQRHELEDADTCARMAYLLEHHG